MSFTDFNFSPHISDAIRECGFVSPTPIQQQAIKPILEGLDLLGLAQTGTGKTAAFILPIVEQLLATPTKQIKTLIIAPTRELAEQINDFTNQIIKSTRLRSISIYGGVSKNAQISKLRAGVNIVVACPGRLLDILNDKAIDLSRIEHLILDEADHMFDQGFLPDIRRILKQLPKKRQSLVFSATMPKEIRHLAEEILHKPVSVQINRIQPTKTVTHAIYDVKQNQKTELLLHMLKHKSMSTTLVFTRTKYKAKNLANKLAKSGFKATSIQGNLSQNRRQQALDGFKDGTFNILVATDIAARGIDVSGISHVINFDVPDTAEAYIHRTGRTGRASSSGDAFTFATADDGKIIRIIERSLNKKMVKQSVSLSPTGRNHDSAGPSRGQERVQTTNTEKKQKARRHRHGHSSSTPAGKGVFGLSPRWKQ